MNAPSTGAPRETVSPYHPIVVAIFILTCAILAFLVIGLALHAFPQTDDVCRARTWPLQPHAGVPAYVSYIYQRWSGRWAAIATEVFVLSSFPMPRTYSLFLLLVMGIEAAIVFLCARQFLRTAALSCGFALLLASLYFAAMPGVPEGFFWLTGAIEYQLPSAFVLLTFTPLLSLPDSASSALKVRRTVLACIFALLVPAFHELLGGLLVLSLTAATIRLVVLKRTSARLWAAVAAAGWLSFLVVYLAPGNAIRMATLPGRANYHTTLRLTIDSLHFQVLPWLLDIKHWVLALLLWVDPRTGELRRHIKGLDSAFSIAGFCALWIALVLAGIIATTWNTAVSIPGRTLNVIYLVFLVGWIGMAFLFTPWISNLAPIRVHRNTLCPIVLLLLSAFLLTSSNTRNAFTDISSGRAAAWNTEWNQRLSLIRTAKSGRDIQLEWLHQYPLSYPPWDITQDPADWRNLCLERFAGAPSVRLAPSPGAAAH